MLTIIVFEGEEGCEEVCEEVWEEVCEEVREIRRDHKHPWKSLRNYLSGETQKIFLKKYFKKVFHLVS